MNKFVLIFVALLLAVSACEKTTEPDPIYEDPITITSPANNASVNGIVTISTAVGEDYTFTRVDFYIDGDSVYSDPSSPFRYAWDTSIYESTSSHQLQAVAYDEEQSYSSNMVTVTVLIPVTNEFEFLSSYALTSPGMRVASEGSHLYVASGTNGLSVFDISNPVSPENIYNYVSTDDIRGVDSDSPYLVTAEWDLGIRLFHIVNSDSIAPVNFFSTQGRAWNVKVIGDMIYVADDNAFQIAEISDFTILARSRTAIQDGVVKDIDVVGSVAYVLDINGVSAYNISNPLSPVFINRYAQFNGQCQTVSSDGDYVFVGTTSELRMLTGGLISRDNRSQQGGFTGVFAAGSVVFASAGSSTGGAWAFDYSSGASMETLDQYISNETSNDITYSDGYVFLAGQTRVSIFSFSF